VTTRDYALVEPQMIAAARAQSGMPEDVAAKKMGISPERLNAWETGQVRPTLRQLRKAARVYRQSLAFFYLPAVPEDLTPSLSDFRRLPKSKARTISSELLLELREANIRREIALDLIQAYEGTWIAPEFSFSPDTSENPEVVGRWLREYLQVDFGTQKGWKSKREAFNEWRRAAESHGILVFQAASVGTDEMRGFSIAKSPLPVVVVNREDAYAGRVFSLLHEIIHLGLRMSALCNLREGGTSSGVDTLEVYCNHAAGAAIVPASELRLEAEALATRGSQPWEDTSIEHLAERFSASCEVIVRRLLILELVTKDFYEKKRAEYLEHPPPTKKGGGFPPPAVDALSKAGHAYTRLVIQSMYDNIITPNDASDYLGIRLRHFESVEEQVGI